MSRLLTLLTLAAFETSLASLPLLALTSLGLPWPLLLLVVLLGAAADQLCLRLPVRLERPVLALGAALGVLLVLASQLGGPGAALAALIPGAEGLALAYALTLITLLLYWRGSRIASHDSLSVSTLFGRGTAAMVTALLIGAVFGSRTMLSSPPILAHILSLISLGLLALALTQTEDGSGVGVQRLGWRWLLSIVLAVGAVILVGIMGLGLLGDGGAGLALGLLQLIVLPFALLGGLIAYLLITFVGMPLVTLLRPILARLEPFQPLLPPSHQPTSTGQDQGMLASATQFAERATWLMALIPLIILVAALLLLRGRSRRANAEDEQRESLDVATSLRGDLRDLLGRLHNPFARRLEGLSAALERLRGDAPATRVRRAYVRFLLRLERRERPRRPTQTPAELAADLDAPPPLGLLTTAYECARYNPAGSSPAEARAAEQALAELDAPD